MINAKYSELTEDQKLSIQHRLDERKLIRMRLLKGGIRQQILLVGDRPGPAAPLDPYYHHTPFYSIKYCSGWLNALLEVNGIPEGKLAWINAYDKDGFPTDPTILEHIPKGSTVILLGGAPQRWWDELSKSRPYPSFFSVLNFPHPQFWKRFKSKEPYPLISTLGTLTSTRPSAAR